MKKEIRFTYNDVPIESLSYRDFCCFLQEMGNEEKAEFEKRIVNTTFPIYGLYSDQKDALVNYLKKHDQKAIFSYPGESYEVLYLQGRLIAVGKTSPEEKMRRLYSWLSSVDNWALTDSVMKGVRIKDSELQLWYSFIDDLVTQEGEFFVRFGVILLLSYFLTDDWIDRVFMLLKTVRTGRYYIDMAMAWLCATTLIRYKEKTLDFLKNAKNLNAFTVKKTFQKARESFRISDADKAEYAGYQRSFPPYYSL